MTTSRSKVGFLTFSWPDPAGEIEATYDGPEEPDAVILVFDEGEPPPPRSLVLLPECPTCGEEGELFRDAVTGEFGCARCGWRRCNRPDGG